MYYPDLSSYEYIGGAEPCRAVNVGWLDSEHAFQKGSVSEMDLARILALCTQPVNRTRGYHTCDLCGHQQMGVPVEAGDTTIVLGGAEIRVTSDAGKIYAAPDLIYHYVKEHRYNPPAEFLEALAGVNAIGSQP